MEYRQHTILNYEMGDFYTKHVMAMTVEALHSKAEIAQELAWRDMQIEKLRDEIESLRECLEGE